MEKKGATYQYHLKVEKQHLDDLNHVNNMVYIQWINDISEKHWDLITNPELEENYFWVVLRHEVDYLGQALLDDELTLKTNVGETGGVKSVREVYIYKGDTLLVQAKTTWCLVNRKTLKPQRIGNDILAILFPEN
ncbi:acyl-CoA thioesterase [Gaetbulibacter aestuarii]|uniref:Thioesterase family protein n=1 Tax=Gaetbulibacter aestuarii TaxID=1502358 RepID=A0ABW7N4F4_9FLAO